MKNLSAQNMKGLLWETLHNLKEKKINPAEADSIATQCREIIRVIKSQQSIMRQGSIELTQELKDYATNS